MKTHVGVALAFVCVALAGCAEEPAPVLGGMATDGLDAYAVLQDNPVGGDATLLGFFAHGAPAARVPWPLGPMSTYEHLHLASGKNPAMDEGTANTWYSIHLTRSPEAKIAFSQIAGSVDLQRSFDAEHFGWKLEWPEAEEAPAEGSRALHGGHVCEVGSYTDDWNVGSQDAWLTAHADPTFANFAATNGGDTLMLYLPKLFMHGDACTRATPLGFEFLPQTNVWAVFHGNLDTFLQSGSFTDAAVALVDADTGDLLEARTFAGAWGTQVRHSQTHQFHSDLPGTPVLAQTYEVPFSVPEGATGLEVAARVLGGPEVYSDPTITLVGPGFEETLLDIADWSLNAPGAGAWTVRFSIEQAQPMADYTFDVVALTR